MARLNRAHFFEADYFNGNSPSITSREFILSRTSDSPQRSIKSESIEIHIRQENSKSQNEEEAPYTEEERIKKQLQHTKFKGCLNPLLFLMKLAGLYFDDSGKINLLNKLSQLWSYLMNLCIVAYFIYSCTELGMSSSIMETYMKACNMLSLLKCAIQVTIIIRLCRKRFLWKFISQLEAFLAEIVTDQDCKNVENKLVKKSYFFLAKIIFSIVFYGGGFSIGSYFWSDNVIYKSLDHPLLPPYSKIFFNSVIMSSWLLPMSLCIALGNALVNTFKAFYHYLSFIQRTSVTQGLCCKKFVRHIRQSYITLTRLCDDFDDMFSLMLMFNYLIDLILVCLELRLVMFTYTNMASRLILCLLMFLPVVSLLLISATTSQLYEEGQKIRTFVQTLKVDNVDMDSKVELDLLLFHISSDPVVMTIWKMIPLNRSIIVSIFVSIVTYFAMLLSFL